MWCLWVAVVSVGREDGVAALNDIYSCCAFFLLTLLEEPIDRQLAVEQRGGQQNITEYTQIYTSYLVISLHTL